MKIQKKIEDHLEEKLKNFSIVAQGSWSSAWLLETKSNRKFFLKTNTGNLPQMFQTEKEGLQEIAKGYPKLHKLSTPQIHYVAEDMLLMDYIPSHPKTTTFFKKLGNRLAKMHRMTEKKFGFARDNYIGGSRQENGWESSWSDFFWRRRLGFQMNLLNKRYSPLKNQLAGLESNIKDLLHESSPSLLHGDLWGGNIQSGPGDEPFLVDPAVYYGDREADLAMTRLFGGFPDEFYKAYAHEYPLKKGYEKREIIYNLYHLLNHLNLFGSSYQSQVKNSLDKITPVRN